MYCPQCASENIVKLATPAGSGRNRWRCRDCKTRTTRPLEKRPQILPKFKKSPGLKRYIITHAVNDTKVEIGFLKSLETMAKITGAQLIVIAGVYKNPDMVKRGFLESLSWPSEVLPYICRDDFKINSHLVVRGATRIEHCVINPLAGMNHSAGTYSEIFAHPQLAMEVLPTPKDEVPRMLITTGTVSKRNYGGSARAKKASFHHNNSAIFVETSGDKFWLRPVSWDGRRIQDLKSCYYPDGNYLIGGGEIESVVFGDLHVDCMRQDEKKAVLSLCKKLGAASSVICDVLDMHTGSHHKIGDVLLNLRAPNFDVRGELDRTCKYLEGFPKPCYVVSSNHHDHLEKWFNGLNAAREQVNLALYFELGELAKRYPGKSLFELYCTKIKGLKNLVFISEDRAFDIKGIDVSQHGHRGPNGSRGSGKAFAKTGRRTITQHAHTPGINKGNWVVGTSAMHLAYAHGYSSWLELHVIIYPNGKRSFITRIKGRFSPMVDAL